MCFNSPELQTEGFIVHIYSQAARGGQSGVNNQFICSLQHRCWHWGSWRNGFGAAVSCCMFRFGGVNEASENNAAGDPRISVTVVFSPACWQSKKLGREAANVAGNQRLGVFNSKD